MHTPAHQDYGQLYDLSMEFMDPEGAERAMRRSLKSKIKLQDKIILKDQMMCLKSVGTNEVQCAASKIAKKIKFDREGIMMRLITFIMKMKIEDINRDIEEEKFLSEKNQTNLDEFVRPNTVAASVYRKIVKNKLEDNWKKEKEKVRGKVKHLKRKCLSDIREQSTRNL